MSTCSFIFLSFYLHLYSPIYLFSFSFCSLLAAYYSLVLHLCIFIFSLSVLTNFNSEFSLLKRNKVPHWLIMFCVIIGIYISFFHCFFFFLVVPLFSSSVLVSLLFIFCFSVFFFCSYNLVNYNFSLCLLCLLLLIVIFLCCWICLSSNTISLSFFFIQLHNVLLSSFPIFLLPLYFSLYFFFHISHLLLPFFS